MGYYKCFDESFSSITGPLTKFTQKKISFYWSKSCKVSFQKPKDLLTLTPILSLPNESMGFFEFCDAFDMGLDVVLI